MGKPRVLKVEIVSDAKGFAKGTRDAADETSKFERSIAAVDRAVKPALGALGAVGAASLGAAKAAADMSGAVAKSSKVWATQSDAMAQWAATAASSVGMSSQAALGATASIGNYWQQLGKSEAEAAKLSTSTVQLAADLAAFAADGTSTTQVLDMISAAMRGEYDSIQRLIPSINGASVEAKALEMSHKSSAKALTDADKATAAYALLLAGAGPSMGAFAANSGQAAVQQQTLTASVQTLAAQLGAALLPALQSSLAAGLAVTQWAADHARAVQALAVVLGTLAAAVLVTRGAMAVYQTAATLASVATKILDSDIVKNIATNVGYYATLGITAAQLLAQAAASGVAKAATAAWSVVTKAAKVAQMALNAALAANPIGAVIALVAALAAGLTYAYQHCETFRAIVDRLASLLGGAVSAAFRTVKGLVDGFVGAIRSAVGWVQNLIGAIGNLLSKLNPFRSGGAFGGLFHDAPDSAVTATVDLTRGADRSARASRAAVAPLAPPVARAAPRLPRGAALRGAAGATQLVTVNVSGALDPVAVARQIDQLLTRRQRLLGAAQ